MEHKNLQKPKRYIKHAKLIKESDSSLNRGVPIRAKRKTIDQYNTEESTPKEKVTTSKIRNYDKIKLEIQEINAGHKISDTINFLDFIPYIMPESTKKVF